MTKQEVIAIIGKPYSMTRVDDVDSWLWLNVNVNFFTYSSSSRSLWLTFRDGKLLEVPKLPDEFK